MKKILITGISRGIGKATCEKFLSEGWQVRGTSTSGQTPVQHQNLLVNKLDLLNNQDIISFSEEIEKSRERFDVFLNNAAVSISSGGNMDIEILRKTLEVNLIGLIDLTERIIPYVNDGGHIVNMSSSLASLTNARDSYAPAYRISKAGVNMYTRILASRLRNRRITVSSFNPGWVKTDMGGPGATRNPSEPAGEIYELVQSNNIESGSFWSQGRKMSW